MLWTAVNCLFVLDVIGGNVKAGGELEGSD